MAPQDPQQVFRALDKLIDLKKANNDADQLKRIEEPVSPEIFLTSRYYSGFGPGELFPFWVREICDFLNNGYTELVISGSIGCFVGSTKIPLLDGTVTTAKELAEKHPEGGDPFYVYSCDKRWNAVPGKAIGCWKTSDSKKVYKVTLDNGSEEFFTANHLFLMRNGSYRAVEHLQSGDMLMPLYHKDWPHLEAVRRIVSVEYSHEEAVYDIEVEEHHNFALDSGVFVHNSGKSTAANLLLMYKFYELFCWANPNAYLGLPNMQTVENLYMSVSLKQASRTGFSQFRSMVDNSQWFKDNAPRRKDIDSVLEWRDGKFTLFPGSSPQHAIGMTVWSTILDEADFFKKTGHAFDETYEAVTDLYEELSDRRTSRFRKHGKDLSFSILISSATFQSSFVARRIAAAATDPSIKVINAISYKIKPAGTYSDNKFYVFKGHKLAEPEIIRDKNHLNDIMKKLRIKYTTKHALGRAYTYLPPRVKDLIEQVPEDFRTSFERNIHKALMNHSGVSAARVGRLFQSKSLLEACYDKTIVHPFLRDEIVLSTADNEALKDYFLAGNLSDIEKPHAIHIDQSLSSDPTGISMVRYDGSEKDASGIHVRKFTHIFSIRILPPPPPATIKISKSREFVLWLREYGVNIVRVTMDQFQSRDSMQILTEKGIPTEYQSLDRKDDAYLAWLQLLQDKAVRMYRYQPLEEEAMDAVHDRRRRKVDHPKGGRIDVLQSFVGALYSLVGMSKMPVEVDTSFIDSFDSGGRDQFGMQIARPYDSIDSAYKDSRQRASMNSYLDKIL